MSTNLNDLELLTRDYAGSYSTGTADQEKVYRAINRAIEYVKREVSFPNDEKTNDFYFTVDQYYYDLPSDFAEALLLTYRKESANNVLNGFVYHDYPDILERAGSSVGNRWTIVHFNGKRQLLIVGSNQYPSSALEAMDSLTGWAVSDDASDLTLNTDRFFTGNASLAFDVVRSAGYATVTKTLTATDLSHVFARKGQFKLNTFLTDNNVTSVSLKVLSSVSDYYVMSATLTDNGIAFPEDEWFRLAFDTTTATKVGDPDTTAITSYQIEFTLPGSFTAATDFGIDTLYTVFPEELRLVYSSNAKGTNQAGTENKQTLTHATDVLAFSDQYDDYADVICQRAAINLWPQLRGDNESYALLVRDFRTNMKSFTKRHPRRRVQGVFRHKLQR